MRQLKIVALVAVFMVALIAGLSLVGGVSITSANKADAARCCWVMVCTEDTPPVCWEECRPCPAFPLP